VEVHKKILSGVLMLTALFSLTGCAEVSTSALVFDSSHASFLVEETIDNQAVDERLGADESLTPEERCAQLDNKRDELVSGSGYDYAFLESSCSDEGVYLSALFEVSFTYQGIQSVNGVEINSAEREKLPFSVANDVAYGDVVISQEPIGLLDQGEVVPLSSWRELYSDYTITVQFNKSLSDYSAGGVEIAEHTVQWDYAAIVSSMESNNYTFSAAGTSVKPIDPLPYAIAGGATLLALSILLFSMWRWAPSRVITNTSYVLAPLGPFGFALAIIAMQKGRASFNDSRRAVPALWVSGSILTFEIITAAILYFLAPEMTLEMLRSWGMIS